MADGDGGAIWLGVGGVVTAVITGVIALMSALHKNRQESQAGAVGQLERILSRVRRERDEQQGAIGRLHELYAECLAECAEYRGLLLVLHAVAVRHSAALKKLGMEVEDVPPLPPPREPRRPADEVDLPRREPRRPTDEAEFLKRTTEQNKRLAEDADSRILGGAAHARPTGRGQQPDAGAGNNPPP